MPKGGGAIGPIGEKFVAHPQTGTASFSIPIPVTPGRGAITPQLVLGYESGSGNSAFGMGWSVTTPSIVRKTDRGLPHYASFGSVEDDVFILAGAEDLVPTGPPITSSAGEQVIAYRPRVDALFARIERRLRADGVDYWVTITKDNVRSVYGYHAQARVADHDDARRVFRWNLEWIDDDRGNSVAYYYKAEDDVAGSHLKAIGYLNVTPRTLTDRVVSPLGDLSRPRTELLAAWPLVALFDYGDHDVDRLARGLDPDPLVEGTWSTRADAFSSRRATFEVRTRRLCRNVLMLHRVTNDGAYDTVGPHRVVRAVRLHHIETPRVSYLDRVTHEGWRARAGGGYDTAPFPAITLGYTTAEHPDRTLHVLDAESMDGVVAALDGAAAHLADYDGEGLPGIFSAQGAGWFYKRPNGPDGGPRWSPPRRIVDHPAVSLEGGEAQLQDWNGDGALDVVQLRSRVRGVHARQPLPLGRQLLDDGWHAFRAFTELPADIDFADPNLRFADLSGDGFADVVITDDNAIRWHAAAAGIDARGRDGFGPEQRVPKSGDGGPPVFANKSEAVLFADMTGDGLADIVHVCASACAYWPNLGYGRFGARVVMRNAPVLAPRVDFDPARVRFADFDGTGTADLVYLDHDVVRIYPNQAGNSFGDELRLPLPQPGHVEITDVWGRGTATILWSSAQPRDRSRPVRYVDLFSAKPHLLTSIDNGHGLSRMIDYAPSTRFSLADRKAGRPWITRLPFGVQVVERVVTADAVAKTTSVVTYAYHHGYYDGPEREFRGFGMVEQRDAEDAGTYYGVSDASVAAVDRALHRPPALTKTWFHTGAFVGHDIISRAYAGEYDRSDPLASALADTVLPAGLTPAETREAVRALRGRTLRVEVYAEDADPTDPATIARAALPYAVTETNFTLRLEQPMGERRHGVFSVHPRETVAYHYERNPNDPRITHELATTVSATGVVVDKVSLAYPRRGVTPPSSLTDRRAGQAFLLASLAHVELVAAPVAPESHRIDVPIREDLFELVGLPSGRQLDFDEVASFVAGAIESPYTPHRRRKDWLAFSTGKHLLQRSRHRFCDDDGVTVLPYRGVTARALPARTETLAHTAATLAPIAARDATIDFPTVLPAAGYVGDPDGTYWAPSETARYASKQFYVVIAATNPFGGIARVEYDALAVLPTASYDAMSNPTRIVTRDYRLFQPQTIEDPNGTHASVDTDVRGIVTATYIRQGSQGGQTAQIDYAFYAAGVPTWVRTVGYPDYKTPIETSILYTDGSGREALHKVSVPPAHDTTTPRWLGTGLTIFDNKNQPVKQYEPYFSPTSDYEGEDVVARLQGVTPVTLYDPLDRAVRVDLPDGTFTDVAFDAWAKTSRDQIDTLGPDVPWYRERLKLAANDPRRIAAEASFEMRGTPTIEEHDVLGRAMVTSQDLGSRMLQTSQEFDLEGNVLCVTDPRQVEVATNLYDVAGRVVEVASVDAGLTTTLHDAAGKPLIVWRGDGADLVRIEHIHDIAERPTHVWVTDRYSPARSLRERIVYRDWSESTPPPTNGAGRVFAELDGAGSVAYGYDFAGNQASLERRLTVDYRRMPAWDAADGWDGIAANPAESLLDPERFTIASSYDAMNRLVHQVAPDGSVTVRNYDVAGRLAAMAITDPTAATQSIVDHLHYDEKSRRKRIEWGHQVISTYDYDPQTFRLSHLSSLGPAGENYQDLTYTYDAVGNITRIHDASQDTLYFKNIVVRPEMDYTYDPIYRLISGAGREHRGQALLDQRDVPDALVGVPVTNPKDLAAIGTYLEEYEYDDSGNITQLRHRHNSEPAWVRGYTYPSDSNRLSSTDTSSDGSLHVDYPHDRRGNMVAMAHLFDMRWTHRDQMWCATRTKVGNGTVLAPPDPARLSQPVFFSYDNRGQRVRKTSENGALVRDRVYVGAFEIYRERNGVTLQLERTTLHASDGDHRFAMLELRTAQSPDDGTNARLWRLQHDNHLGSSMLELSDTRSPVAYEESTPYGTSCVTSLNETAPPKRFHATGMERDDNTGFYVHGVRYFAPWIGRWTSADPTGLKDANNLYSYVRSSPLSLIDRTGKDSQESEYGPTLTVSTQTHTQVNKSGAAFHVSETTARFKLGLIDVQMTSARRTRLGEVETSDTSRGGASLPELNLTPVTEPIDGIKPHHFVSPTSIESFHKRERDAGKTFGERLAHGMSALGVAPFAGLAGMVRNVLNVPYHADRAGQLLARAVTTKNTFARVDDFAEATSNLAEGFTGAASAAVPIVGATTGRMGTMANNVIIPDDVANVAWSPEASTIKDILRAELEEQLGAYAGRQASQTTWAGTTESLPLLHNLLIKGHSFDVVFDYFPEHKTVIVRDIVNIVFGK